VKVVEVDDKSGKVRLSRKVLLGGTPHNGDRDASHRS
jgi:hypothetical protein